jgi:prepilin-type N-terminal cleavage/methylation domain-containing protein
MPRAVGHRGRRLERWLGRARRPDRGDTLIEVLLTIVIMGVIFSAFFAAISTSSSASVAHRNFVTADALLRNAAEGAKSAARANCATSTTYTTTTTTLPAGFSLSNDIGFAGADGLCPTSISSVQTAQFTVTLPSGATRSLQIDVRQP